MVKEPFGVSGVSVGNNHVRPVSHPPFLHSALSNMDVMSRREIRFISVAATLWSGFLFRHDKLRCPILRTLN
jgi:hypothetical protein